MTVETTNQMKEAFSTADTWVQIREIANQIIKETGASDPFWEEEEKRLLIGAMAYVKFELKEDEMKKVLEEITNGADKAGGPAYSTMPEMTRKSVQVGLLVRMQPFMVNE